MAPTGRTTGSEPQGASRSAPGPISPARLAALLPDTVAGYGATGPAEARTAGGPAGGGAGTVPQARRLYNDGHRTLLLELMDPLHAPQVLGVVRRGQHQSRRTPDSVTAGVVVGGQWVVTQWTGADQAARVGALVGDRLFYNLTVTPAGDIGPGIAVAEQLDYAAARALLDAAPR